MGESVERALESSPASHLADFLTTWSGGWRTIRGLSKHPSGTVCGVDRVEVYIPGTRQQSWMRLQAMTAMYEVDVGNADRPAMARATSWQLAAVTICAR